MIFGRRLYWLALGGLGFFLGLWAAQRFLDLGSAGLELGAGFLVGIAGAGLAILAQRVAIGLAGFSLGGLATLWLTQPFQGQLGPWVWAVAFLGAFLGTLFAASLFEASLIGFSSLVGALMVVGVSPAEGPRQTWLFLILLVLGVIVQSQQRLRRRLDAKEKDA